MHANSLQVKYDLTHAELVGTALFCFCHITTIYLAPLFFIYTEQPTATFSQKELLLLLLYFVYSEFILLIIVPVLASGHFPFCLFKKEKKEEKEKRPRRYHERRLPSLSLPLERKM